MFDTSTAVAIARVLVELGLGRACKSRARQMRACERKTDQVKSSQDHSRGTGNFERHACYRQSFLQYVGDETARAARDERLAKERDPNDETNQTAQLKFPLFRHKTWEDLTVHSGAQPGV